MTKPTTPTISDSPDYANIHGGMQPGASRGLGFSRWQRQQTCRIGVARTGRRIFQTPPGASGSIAKSESLSRNSIDLTTLTEAFPLAWGEKPFVALILRAGEVRNEAHCALEELPNKVMGAEYQTVLQDKKLLAGELESTQRALEARRMGRADGGENQA